MSGIKRYCICFFCIYHETLWNQLLHKFHFYKAYSLFAVFHMFASFVIGHLTVSGFLKLWVGIMWAITEDNVTWYWYSHRNECCSLHSQLEWEAGDLYCIVLYFIVLLFSPNIMHMIVDSSVSNIFWTHMGYFLKSLCLQTVPIYQTILWHTS